MICIRGTFNKVCGQIKVYKGYKRALMHIKGRMWPTKDTSGVKKSFTVAVPLHLSASQFETTIYLLPQIY